MLQIPTVCHVNTGRPRCVVGYNCHAAESPTNGPPICSQQTPRHASNLASHRFMTALVVLLPLAFDNISIRTSRSIVTILQYGRTQVSTENRLRSNDTGQRRYTISLSRREMLYIDCISGAEQARVHSLDEAGKILDVFQAHKHVEIDTARTYGGGSSEEYLAALDWESRGIVLDTKLSPNGINLKYTHSPSDVRRGLEDSFAALKTEKVDMWYLHAPDHSVPYEETLRAVNELYKEGRFRRFGISNYAAWEVAQISEICIRNGWKRPDVYQGVYNALHRAVELELFPCLRHYGIGFYAFNPLAGGFLTDRYQRDTAVVDLEKGSRFDPEKSQGRSYRGRYWNEVYFDALDVVRPIAKKFDISTAEAALRWVSHHGKLDKEKGDAIIIGASSEQQLEENLVNLEKGALPEELVKAFDEAWGIAKAVVNPYFR